MSKFTDYFTPCKPSFESEATTYRARMSTETMWWHAAKSGIIECLAYTPQKPTFSSRDIYDAVPEINSLYYSAKTLGDRLGKGVSSHGLGLHAAPMGGHLRCMENATLFVLGACCLDFLAHRQDMEDGMPAEAALAAAELVAKDVEELVTATGFENLQDLSDAINTLPHLRDLGIESEPTAPPPPRRRVAVEVAAAHCAQFRNPYPQPGEKLMTDLREMFANEPVQSTACELAILRIHEEPCVIAVFTSECESIATHFIDTSAHRGYVQCNSALEGRCILCDTKRKSEMRVVMPVYDVEGDSIKALMFSTIRTPHSLGPQIGQQLDQGDLDKRFLVISRDYAKYKVGSIPMPNGAESGESVIAEFREQIGDLSDCLKNVIHRMTNADLSAIPEIERKANALGLNIQDYCSKPSSKTAAMNE